MVRNYKQVNGILLLDKPAGLTSNAALQRVKYLFKAKKAGHTGSLDPIATGLLPICFGKATSLSQLLLESDKSYYVMAKLGEQTTTGDSEGKVIKKMEVTDIPLNIVQEVFNRYVGEIEQIPPMFSAIKFKGKPLYELARRGIEIERQPRRITIFSLQLTSLSQDLLVFNVDCSKGTYVRTLVEDIGKDLGCGAHVIGLRRTRVSPYSEMNMIALSTLEEMANKDDESLLDHLLPIESAVQTLPALTLTVAANFYLRTGQSVRAAFPAPLRENTLVRLYSEESNFLGIGETTIDGRVKPYRLVI